MQGRIVLFPLKDCNREEKTSLLICLEDGSIFVEFNRNSSAEFSFLAYFRHVHRKVFLNLKYLIM